MHFIQYPHFCVFSFSILSRFCNFIYFISFLFLLSGFCTVFLFFSISVNFLHFAFLNHCFFAFDFLFFWFVSTFCFNFWLDFWICFNFWFNFCFSLSTLLSMLLSTFFWNQLIFRIPCLIGHFDITILGHFKYQKRNQLHRNWLNASWPTCLSAAGAKLVSWANRDRITPRNFD